MAANGRFRTPTAKRWLAIGLPSAGILAGLYILVTAGAPQISQLPPLQAQSKQRVERKLESAAGTHGNRLYIPKIGVDVAIVHGTTEAALNQGAWHRKPENGDPAHGGNFVLSAHRFQLGRTPQGTLSRSPFYHIDRLHVGDQIQVDYSGKRYVYEVARLYKVTPGATDIENPSADSKLTLYSCTLRGSADGREVVEAVLRQP